MTQSTDLALEDDRTIIKDRRILEIARMHRENGYFLAVDHVLGPALDGSQGHSDGDPHAMCPGQTLSSLPQR